MKKFRASLLLIVVFALSITHASLGLRKKKLIIRKRFSDHLPTHHSHKGLVSPFSPLNHAYFKHQGSSPSSLSSNTRLCPQGCRCRLLKLDCRSLEWSQIPRNTAESFKMVDLGSNQLALVSMELFSRGGLVDVVKLNLTRNGIERVLDGAFLKLTSLQFLDLSHNFICRLSRNTFKGLQLLSFLDLSHNAIAAIDGSLRGMGELVRLNLASNVIRALISTSFQDLGNLRFLNLGNNSVSKIDKKSFKNLAKLINLNMERNPLQGRQRLHISSYSLTHLDLSRCQLKQVPRGLPNSIKQLLLTANSLSRLRKNSFSETPHVFMLVLEHNQLEEIELDTFSKMTYLQQLHLNNNLLQSITFRLPVFLQVLLFNSNLLRILFTSLPHKSFPALHTLSLRNNSLSTLSTETFSKFPNLKYLDLSDNFITAIQHSALPNNHLLSTLNLSSNPLQRLHTRCFSGLYRLSTLDLSHNVQSVIHVDDDVTSDLRHLDTLLLDSSTALSMRFLLSEKLLGGLKSLREMRVQSCGLENYHVLANITQRLTRLKKLVVSGERWNCERRGMLEWLKKAVEEDLLDVKVLSLNKCAIPMHPNGKNPLTFADLIYFQSNSASWQSSTLQEANSRSRHNLSRSLLEYAQSRTNQGLSHQQHHRTVDESNDDLMNTHDKSHRTGIRNGLRGHSVVSNENATARSRRPLNMGGVHKVEEANNFDEKPLNKAPFLIFVIVLSICGLLAGSLLYCLCKLRHWRRLDRKLRERRHDKETPKRSLMARWLSCMRQGEESETVKEFSHEEPFKAGEQQEVVLLTNKPPTIDPLNNDPLDIFTTTCMQGGGKSAGW